MSETALRELRNNASDVMRRVEAGEEVIVTVSGRQVAQVVPLQRRPRSLPWEQVLAHPSDPGLANELRDVMKETTDNDQPVDPWERAAHE